MMESGEPGKAGWGRGLREPPGGLAPLGGGERGAGKPGQGRGLGGEEQAGGVAGEPRGCGAGGPWAPLSPAPAASPEAAHRRGGSPSARRARSSGDPARPWVAGKSCIR